MKKPSGRRTSRAKRLSGEGQDRAAEEAVDVAIRDYSKPARNVLESLHPQSELRDWQALMDEQLLFPQGEHDDLFDGLQTMLEGAMSVRSSGGETYFFQGSIRGYLDDDFELGNEMRFR